MVNLELKKNQMFNKLIDLINIKYYLNIQESILDKSDLADNSWFTGFSEADVLWSKDSRN
jgi:hypothetical protein